MDTRAAAVAALAATVDYAIVPKRFSPGFERHVPRSAIPAIYAGFAAGLAIGALLHGAAPRALRRRRRA